MQIEDFISNIDQRHGCIIKFVVRVATYIYLTKIEI